MKLKVLILDDEQRICIELCDFLTRKGILAESAHLPSVALSLLDSSTYDILILDLKLPEMDGLEFLKIVKKRFPELEVILISGHGDMDTVIQALRSGATDYLKKPFRQSELNIAIERTSKFVHLQQRVKDLKDECSLISKELAEDTEKAFIGESTQIKAVLDEAMRVASFTDTSVLISGESGTGKEIIARIIHYASIRKSKKFCPVNCAAIPENLIESEFFGYKKGTFTGAVADKKGYLESCNGGTLFLDEISEMPPLIQSKLLRVLEERKFLKLGTDSEVRVDIRFICASNKDLNYLQEKGDFRSDLFYRLSSYHIHIPALRERKEDIKPLLNHYLKYFCARFGLRPPLLDPSLVSHLESYHFPGNVRELKNLVERALIINKDRVLKAEDFPLIGSAQPESTPLSNSSGLKENQKRQVISALERTNYNQSQAAKLLGISRHALIRLIKKYQL